MFENSVEANAKFAKSWMQNKTYFINANVLR
jgi:hypothetical protein